ASYLEDTLEHIAKNMPQTHLVIELKSKITGKGMEKITDGLKSMGLENYHYDSFYGKSLETAHSADDNALISKHLFSNIGSLLIPIPFISSTEFKADIYTIPEKFSLGDVPSNTIYGYVTNAVKLEEISQNCKVIGAYARF
ncbi:MAG TPA: hypothetical protein VEC16_02050, partial [Alphaproteobacteria bacterium]|nr:hypothetical protein [Alphaproteobacteria bacterium]